MLISYGVRGAYLCLSESQRSGEFGAFGQRQVLCPLESSVELLQLQARVDGPGLAHLLSLAVHPETAVLRDAAFFWKISENKNVLAVFKNTHSETRRFRGIALEFRRD